MTVGVRLQARLFIIGDGVANTLTVALGDFPLQDVPRKATILSVSTTTPASYNAVLSSNNVIVSTIDGSPFAVNVDTNINVVLDAS